MDVFLNVYDISEYNKVMVWVGLGAFHTAIEVEGVEYSYGFNYDGQTGVSRSAAGRHKIKRRERVLLGQTDKNVGEVVDEVSKIFMGADYHLILKNCNHFSDELSRRLVNKALPSRIHRISQLGLCLTCCLPPGIWDYLIEKNGY